MRKSLRDQVLYQPLFSPWLDQSGKFANLMADIKPYTVVSPDRVWILYSLARQACYLSGDFWECGVYKGGTAMMLAQVLSNFTERRLCLFDTFAGMPDTDPGHDYHRKGDFDDTSLNEVRARVGDVPNILYYAGFIPESFQGLEQTRIAFAHVDVDIYRSVNDCCEFIYPRLVSGGFMVFDDYGFPSCPGARSAVDQFFVDKPECPLVLPTGQALIVKLP